MLDLDKHRSTREAARAAAAGREIGSDGTLPVRLGGEIIATLPAELPLGALQPLLRMDSEITLLLREAMTMTAGRVSADTTALVIDLLTANPNLPTKVVDVVREIGVALLTEEGLARFVAQSPSPQDVGALAKGLFGHFGITLGEASGSSVSSETGGPTSSATSSTDTGSTPAALSDVKAIEGSSERAAF